MHRSEISIIIDGDIRCEFQTARGGLLLHPAERDLLEGSVLVSAADIGVRTGEPSLLDVLASLRLLQEVGLENVRQRIRQLAAYLREGLTRKGLYVRGSENPEEQSGIVSFRREGLDSVAETRRLAGQGIVVAARDGAIRVSPHVYNSEEDIDRLLEAV